MSNAPKKSKLTTGKALALLGMAATVAYTTPTVTQLGQAHAASGGGGIGGFFGMGGGGSGGGGAKPRGFGSGAGGFRVTDPVTLKECGDCHEAYDGDALPQGSWRKIMSNLENHFGENAVLDAQTRSHIEAYLLSKAPPGDGPLRISEQAWFKSEHRGEVSSRQQARAKGWFDCQGCHGGGRR